MLVINEQQNLTNDAMVLPFIESVAFANAVVFKGSK